MKKFIKFLIVVFFIVMIALFTDCKPKSRTITGYLVAKEFIPKHMSNQPELIVNYSIVMPARAPIVTPHNSNSPVMLIKSKWVWYVANKYGVYVNEVDSNIFHTKCCGDTLTILIR